jgi:hypothetical protein
MLILPNTSLRLTSTRFSVVQQAWVWFLNAERDFRTHKCDFDTYEGDYGIQKFDCDTLEYDLDTHECD